MSTYDKLVKEGVCGFCGKYETCSGKRHTQGHLRDLLVDAGIIEDTDAAFTAWWMDGKKHKQTDKDNLLLGHSVTVVWPIYRNRVAYFVRSIL